MITYDDFIKTELKVAKVISTERVEGSEKLLKLRLDLGGEERQIVAGIGKAYEPDALVGKEIVIVANLEPRTFTLRHGSGQVVLESQGMLLAASDGNSPVLLVPEKEVPAGAGVR